MNTLKISLLLATIMTLPGCQVTHVTIPAPGYNHAPAFGYYYKRYPYLHRWDDDLGLYVYRESPDTYYDNNFYFRWSVNLNRWERAYEPRGTWHRVEEREIPARLLKRGRPGPASHAPAHGYYKKYPDRHHWESNLGLYILLDSPDTYYNNNHYIRWSKRYNRWERADEPRGRWQPMQQREVPPKLIKRGPRINQRPTAQPNHREKINRAWEQKRESRQGRFPDQRKSPMQEPERNTRQGQNRPDLKGREKLPKEKSGESLAECEKNGNGRGNSGKCRD